MIIQNGYSRHAHTFPQTETEVSISSLPTIEDIGYVIG